MAQAALLYPSEIIGDSSPFSKLTNGHLPRQRSDAQRLIHDDRELNSVTHVVPPSYVTRHKAEDMTRTADAVTRTKADCLEWLKDDRAIAHEVRLALVSDNGHLKAPRKEIARHARCSHRTVEKWTDPEVPTLPGLAPFLRLVPKSPSLQKMLLRLMTLDPDIDPEYQRAAVEFQRAAVELIKKAQR